VPSKSYAATIRALRMNLKRQRSFLGLSREEVAERLGMATRHYQKTVSGELNVTMGTLCRVADALRIEPAALLIRKSPTS
jgi:transcriptional regulator with XRE-family HTH domain